jgi:hypothetical protein
VRLEVSARAQGVPFDPDRLNHPTCLRADGVLTFTVDSLGEHLELASAGEIVSKVLPVASRSCSITSKCSITNGVGSRPSARSVRPPSSDKR